METKKTEGGKNQWEMRVDAEVDYIIRQCTCELGLRVYLDGETVTRIKIRDNGLFRKDILSVLNKNWDFLKKDCIGIKCEMDDEHIIIVKMPWWNKILYFRGYKQ